MGRRQRRGIGVNWSMKSLERLVGPEHLGPHRLQPVCRFPFGDNVTWPWRGDEETGKDLRFMLQLEPTGHGDGALGEEQGERGINGVSLVLPPC